MMETEARVLQQTTDNPRNIDVQASQVVSAFAGEPVNEESALLGATGKRKDSQSGSPSPPNAWYDPQFEGLPWYRRPGVCISFSFLKMLRLFLCQASAIQLFPIDRAFGAVKQVD